MNSLLVADNGAQPVLVSQLRTAAIVPALSQALDVFDGGLGNALWDKAAAKPSLDLDFATTKSLIDRISGQNLIAYTRLLGATYVGSDGLIKTAAANEPRFTHNPTTLESLGLLVEEPRSNEVRNSAATGAVAGTPGTLPTDWSGQASSNGWTREIVGTGVDSQNGLSYIDIRFYGTPTNAQFSVTFQGQGVVSAANGQAWAPSVYHKLVAGNLGNIIGYPAVNLWNSSNAYLAGLAISGTATPSASWTRYAGSATITAANTAFISWGLTFVATIGNTYDFTIRFAAPQLERGALATSVIPTSGISATRNADVVSITGANFSNWYNQTEGTVLAQYRFPQSPNTGGARVYQFTNSTGSNIIWLRAQGGTNRLYDVTDASVSQASFSAGTYAAGTEYRGAMSVKANDFAFAENGGTLQTDASGTVPSVDRIGIGMEVNSGASQGNVIIKRLTYWPKALPTKLQTLTA